MEIGQAIRSIVGRAEVVQKHFDKLANATAILQALSERSAPEKADWHSRRLDGFIAHVVGEAASDARKLYDAMHINSFRGQRPVLVYNPKIIDGKADLSDAKSTTFYSACSIIDHSFRISAYSTLREIAVSVGASKIPAQTEKLSKFRMIVGESQKDGFYCIVLNNFTESIEPFLKHYQKSWEEGQLKLDPRGFE